MTQSIRVWLVLLQGICLLTGCAAAPQEQPPPPRIEEPLPPPRPTHEPSVQQTVDRSVQLIADSLLSDPAVNATKHRLIFMLAQPEEASDRSASMIRSIQNGLARNKPFSRTFRIVTAQSSEPAEFDNLTGGKSPDDVVLPDSDEDIGQVVYDPRDVYILSGNFTKQDRFTEYRYSVSLRIDHPQKNQTVLARDVSVVYKWDPDTLQWYEAR